MKKSAISIVITVCILIQNFVVLSAINNSFSTSKSITNSSDNKSSVKTLLSYSVVSLDSNTCNVLSNFTVTILCNNPISKVSGFDIELLYDQNIVTPSDTVMFDNSLINNQYIGYTVNNKRGKLITSVYLNGNGGNTFFKGTGKLATFTFRKTPNFKSNDSVMISANLVESYDTHTSQVRVEPTIYKQIPDSVFNGKITNWWQKGTSLQNDYCSKSKIIKNRSDSTKSFLSNCDGSFILYNQTTDFSIVKQIDKSANVLSFINGYDAFLTTIVAVDDPSYVPTIYQIMAMDVNQDGIISAGDVSLINKRAENAIKSFSQTNALASDFIYIDEEIVNSNPRYKISSLYPMDDGKGFSRYNVPKATSQFSVIAKNGCPKSHASYVAILLGDVNGNYIDISSLKSTSIDTTNKVVFDFKNAISAYQNDVLYLDVPVIIKSILGINALDFSFHNDESRLQFTTIVNANSSVSTSFYASATESLVRFTSYSKTGGYEINKPIVYARFKIINDGFSDGVINSIDAYINGEHVYTEITSKESKIIEEPSHIVEVYPNPVTDHIQIVVSKTSKILIFSEFNQLIYTIDSQEANQINSINLEGLLSGIYYIKVSNNTSTITKVFVKH